MRKLVFVVCAVLLFGSAAMAQGKIDSSWQCPKATAEHKLDVGDEPNHAYSISAGSCTATKSMIEGVTEKTSAYAEFHDEKAKSMSWHGRLSVTMDNGDKIFYNYAGSGSNDVTKPVANKWTITGGTGKFKGFKATGTCSGKRSADGSSTWDCTGTYTTAK
jgi:hypothetical protein